MGSNMAAIDRLRDRFQQTWTSINEGWHRLTDAAGQAITRFTPGKRQAASGKPKREARTWPNAMSAGACWPPTAVEAPRSSRVNAANAAR